jgi:hypothetical protein
MVQISKSQYHYSVVPKEPQPADKLMVTDRTVIVAKSSVGARIIRPPASHSAAEITWLR